jgi:hypothetical protein
MNEADFDALREHLHEVRPIIDAFCERHGFVYADPMTLGRYPRIRIERRGAVTVWFDLWMEFDKNGRYFKKFWRGIPYELSAGASFDIVDESLCGVGFYKVLTCFSAVPFEQVGSMLMEQMEKHVDVVMSWDEALLRREGTMRRLGA